MTQGSVFWPEVDDQLARLRFFATIAGVCLGVIAGTLIALLSNIPGSQGVLAGILALTAAPIGWLAGRQVNVIKALLDDLTSGRPDSEEAWPLVSSGLDICLSCGAPLRGGLAYCTNCGQSLGGLDHV